MKHLGIPITLGETEYIVPPLNLNALIQLQDRLANFQGSVDSESVSTVIDASYLALKRNYPEFDKEILGECLDLGNMMEIMQAVMDISGMRRKGLEEAKKDAMLGEAASQ